MMVIENLPRLTDEERDALSGGHVAMEGVPAVDSFDDLIAQRSAALRAMRATGSDMAAFSAASRLEAELAVQIRRTRRRASDSYRPDCHGSALDPLTSDNDKVIASHDVRTSTVPPLQSGCLPVGI